VGGVKQEGNRRRDRYGCPLSPPVGRRLVYGGPLTHPGGSAGVEWNVSGAALGLR